MAHDHPTHPRPRLMPIPGVEQPPPAPPTPDIYVHYRPVPTLDDADYLDYLWPPAAGVDDIPTTAS